MLGNHQKGRLFYAQIVQCNVILRPDLPRSVAVDVERPGHQDHDHRSDGFALSIKVVVAQKLQLFLGYKQLLSETREINYQTTMQAGDRGPKTHLSDVIIKAF